MRIGDPKMTEKRPLFRPEAVAFQRQSRLGEIVLLQPLPGRLLFWSFAATFVLIVAFLCLAQYARKETVAGYLVPTAGIARIFVPRAGTVTAVHVAEGEAVAQGDALLTVQVDQTAADGSNVDATLLETLAGQKTALRDQVAMQEGRTVSERKRLAAQVAAARDQIAQLESQIALQQERIELAGSIIASAEGLRSKGYFSELDYKHRQQDYAESKQALAALRQQLALRHAEESHAAAELEQLPAVIAEKVQALRNQLAEAEQRAAEIEGRRAYIVRAPVAGRVSTLLASVGHAADPRQPQLSLLPGGSALEAELFVPAQAIGFVRPGLNVRILLDAFPYQRFGTTGGHVLSVARTMLSAGDASVPVQLRAPAYKVTVALDRQDITAHGERIPLQPDMLLKADIVLDRRPLLSWLFGPVFSARVS
jgi:membrane fusion protein